jgi:hypothetical protein
MAEGIEIVHAHAEGTIATGIRKGDKSAEILKANSWRWSHQLDAWYLPRSRDQLAQTVLIRATEEALTAAGFDVSVNVDDTTTRPVAERRLSVSLACRHGQRCCKSVLNVGRRQPTPPGPHPVELPPASH